MKRTFATLIRQTVHVERAFGPVETLRRVTIYLASRFLEDFYQRPIINCIIKHIDTHFNTFIDIGAHVGTIIKHVSRYFDFCIAVEPLPSNLAELQRNIRIHRISNCLIFPIALGETEGMKYLYYDPKMTDQASFVEYGFPRSFPVRVKTLDQLVRETRVKEPYFIKADVQGYEFKVFRGGMETLGKKCLIISEFWPFGLRVAGDNPHGFIKFMREYGYKVYDLYGKPFNDSRLIRLCRLGAHDRFVVTDLFFSKS